MRDPAPGVRGGLAEGVAAGDAALGSQGQEEGDLIFRRLNFFLTLLKHTSHVLNIRPVCFERTSMSGTNQYV